MATIQIDETYNRRAFTLFINDTLELRLHENPTTGYRWEFTNLNKKEIEIIDDDYTIKNLAAGNGGERVFKLKVIHKSKGLIKLENRQSWSGKVHKTFELTYN